MLAGQADWKRGSERYLIHRLGERSYHPSMLAHANRTAECAFLSVSGRGVNGASLENSTIATGTAFRNSNYSTIPSGMNSNGQNCPCSSQDLDQSLDELEVRTK